MTIAKGSITINPSNGNHSGDGASFAIFEAYIAKIDLSAVTGTALAKAKQQVADLVEAFAEVIPYITTNAQVKVTITSSDAGLQRLPASMVEDEPTKAPAGDVEIHGVVT